MSIKSIAAKIFAKAIVAKTKRWSANPVKTQQKVFSELIKGGKNTLFGKDHNFAAIENFHDFASKVPIRD